MLSRRLVDEFEASGLERAQFCRKRNLALSTLGHFVERFWQISDSHQGRPGALVFALLYVWRRDLPSNMLAHFLADAAGFLTQ
jgi:hypothetical protein